MKRNLIYSVFAAILLASCSSDDIPAPAPAPETLDAYVSLGISNGAVKTKADGDGYGKGEGPDPAGTTAINSFTVAIFRGKPSASNDNSGTTTVAQPEGSLIYLNTFDLTQKEAIGEKAEGANKLCVSNIVKSENGTDYQINGIKIKGGNIHVLIMANMPKELLDNMGGKTMDEIQALTYGNLANEGFNNKGNSYPCSMTSKWLKYDVKPTNNGDAFYLFDKIATPADQTNEETDDQKREFSDKEGEAIPLYRNVSAIGFKTISFQPSDGWGKKNGATLTLKSIFVTNAISSTSMTVGTKINKPVYYCGHTYYVGEGKDAVLATTGNKSQTYFINNWTNGPVIAVQGSKKGEVSKVLPAEGSEETCVGKYFMVYENSKSMGVAVGHQTLLVLFADYKYNDDLGVEHELENRFYTVVVNDENNTGGTGYANFVERNYIYKVNLQVVGPGSVNPYIPLYTANATAFVEAAPWTGAIDINQDAE